MQVSDPLPEDLSTPVVKLNGREITAREVGWSRAELYQGLVAAGQNPFPQSTLLELTRDALENVVEQQLLISEARNKVPPPDRKAVDAHWRTMRKSAGSNRALAEMFGVDPQDRDSLEGCVRDDLLYRLYLDSIGGAPEVTEDQCRQYITEHPEDFREPESIQIKLLEIPMGAGADILHTQALLMNLRQLAGQGIPFEAISIKLFGDTSYVRGFTAFDVEAVSKDRVLRPVLSLKENEISEPVQDAGALWLLQRGKHLPARNLPDSEAMLHARAVLTKEQDALRWNTLLDGLRRSANIEYLWEELAPGASGKTEAAPVSD